MAGNSQSNRDEWIKNPNPSLSEVALYTTLYVLIVTLLLPLILVTLVVVRINDGFWMSDFLRGYYYSCLYGRH